MAGALHGVLASLKAAAGAATDAFFRYVSLLLNTTSTNGAQNNTFLDSSTNNFSITRNGNTTQGTFSPFSQTGWSNYFDGTGDYLSVADNVALQMGSGDFTIEFWWNPASIANFQTVLDKGYTAAGGLLLQTGSGNGTIVVYAAGATVITASSGSSVGTWDHYALVRSGTTMTLYRNGASVGSATNSTNFNSTASLFVGGSTGGGGYYVNGYLSNARIVKGTAVYTSNFTPPTSPLTAITNTSLLTCQSNRFIDNSSNAFAITRNGDVSVQAFSPFAPTAAWSASTNGGSGYFDGNGDELNAGSNAAFSFGTGAYTVEAWVYLNSAVSATHQPCFVFNDTTNGFGFWNENGLNQLNIGIRGVATALASTTTLAPNIWNHIVAVRSGTGANQTAIFVNGTRVANGTDANNWTITGPLKIGGITTANFYLNGYASNVRVVKGTAVYDPTLTTLTVPTAPLTAITNTSLLLNFTNAGIYDSASGNDLETVGNAQVSTVQSKWGTTSLAFDGTGDWLVMPTSNKNTFGSGDFTIELWVYFSVLPTSGVFANLIDFRPTGVNGLYPTLYVDGTTKALRYFVNNVDRISGSSALNSATWYHIAISRSGSNTRLFLNGTQEGSTYVDTNSYITGSLRPVIGANGFDTSLGNFNGYLDDVRITNGVARYTSNFTAPTAAFPLQ